MGGKTIIRPYSAHNAGVTVVADPEEQVSDLVRDHAAQEHAGIGVDSSGRDRDPIREHGRQPAAIGLLQDVGDAEGVRVERGVQRGRIDQSNDDFGSTERGLACVGRGVPHRSPAVTKDGAHPRLSQHPLGFAAGVQQFHGTKSRAVVEPDSERSGCFRAHHGRQCRQRERHEYGRKQGDRSQQHKGITRGERAPGQTDCSIASDSTDSTSVYSDIFVGRTNSSNHGAAVGPPSALYTSTTLVNTPASILATASSAPSCVRSASSRSRKSVSPSR